MTPSQVKKIGYLPKMHDGELKIASWNIRSLISPKSLECVKNEMRRHNISLMGLTEIRWKRRGDIEDDGLRILFQEGKRVSLFLCMETANVVKEVECISDRMMIMRLKAASVDIHVKIAYMPTSAHVDEEMVELYEQMEDKIEGLPNRE